MSIRLSGMAVLVVLLAACEESGPSSPPEGEMGHLEGAWEAEFRLTSTRLVAGAAAADSLGGELVLVANRTLRTLPGMVGTPTHYGAYAADFRRFGLALPAAGRVPTAAARLLGGDSVVMALDPGAASMTLVGRLEGDSVSGRWWYGGDRGARANGRFVLRREADED